MAKTFTFNPERVAYFEAAGWRAYYDHKWLKMLRLIVSLCQEQFRIPFPMSLLAGYYTTRASAAWVPVHHDEQKVLRYLEKFYQVWSYNILTFTGDCLVILRKRNFYKRSLNCTWPSLDYRLNKQRSLLNGDYLLQPPLISLQVILLPTLRVIGVSLKSTCVAAIVQYNRK
jgi:hypothetical protein